MKRITKIICTLGPASDTKEMICRLARAGMDVARLNFSHGTHEYHQKVIRAIREANKELKTPVRILQDLEGYRIRIGVLKAPLELKKGTEVWMTCCGLKEQGALPLDADLDMSMLKEGMDIFIADGVIALKVAGRKGQKVRLKVMQGGPVSSKKGVNIPDLKLEANILTVKDKKDIEFGILNKVDYVAQSFVRNKEDIRRVSGLLKARLPGAKIIAKIENREGVRNIKSIISACDGIMVARGDMGVSLPIYQVPVIQKAIIRLCNQRKKIDITATQMLESMTENPRPTRAEVSDVANAIFDGSDYVMLSAETAVGRFPVECVTMMRQIIEFTEQADHKGRSVLRHF